MSNVAMVVIVGVLNIFAVLTVYYLVQIADNIRYLKNDLSHELREIRYQIAKEKNNG